MFIFPTKNISLIEGILNDPELKSLTDGQSGEEIARINPAFEYLIAINDNYLCGMFSIRKVTNRVLEGHIRILPRFWKTEIPSLALNKACEFVKEYKDCSKVITTVPSNCYHVLKFISNHEFKQCGEIHEGIIYNNELVSLLIFERGV